MYQIVYAILNEIKIQHRRSSLVATERSKVLDLLKISLGAVRLAMALTGSDEVNVETARKEFEAAIRQYDWGM